MMTMTGYWIVLWAGVLGFVTAVTLILALALPSVLSAPDDVHRTSAGMFTISYSVAMVLSVLGGWLWDLTHSPIAGLGAGRRLRHRDRRCWRSTVLPRRASADATCDDLINIPTASAPRVRGSAAPTKPCGVIMIELAEVNGRCGDDFVAARLQRGNEIVRQRPARRRPDRASIDYARAAPTPRSRYPCRGRSRRR